ncbi:hypothetical protein PHYBLDRAFT_145095 [Phycomyces blakesleeanus NRRL 1555(-)]|uniref:Uncharacterized protein n=1 Tax=Phycomyces blakesleeanus (strain ATCC 8743b / DSM 1359 / FGSC 10004 / NBRC 33097 / NRRL 1555) TaxID=763407 RepID=A0A162PKA6_PHYB8|nr:hypothetical protein PHYBLDRAFT_145095 [Phycomyces blakesleeanus NRRL 1555(-)]OAD73617.1 hypothetical protein PHYBLDRAFT_145095 [Phycomyces blakesleeanus NRRL 1555(-)]|eukprot:XP_018291657.1 hypothetical protein PHYBLDRAFT_145095 [Phycomyces blakesleeanus NRRL 1555(-)]
MAILQDAVARQYGELERVQAKGITGCAVTAKLDFPKTRGLSKMRVGPSNTTFLVVPTTNVVPSGQLNNHIPARSSSIKENPVSEEQVKSE